MSKPPLILTLSIEKEAELLFNSLRRKYFPPSLNLINAHLTLFHALPDNAEIKTEIEQLCETQHPFKLSVKEVVSIGKGVAYKIESKELQKLHKTLKNKWLSFLSRQDSQTLWPHITVQNKVTATEAGQVLNELKKGFTPFSTSATGLQLWKYLNGPWELSSGHVFKGVHSNN